MLGVWAACRGRVWRVVAGKMERSQKKRIGKWWTLLAEKRTVVLAPPVLEPGEVSCTKEIQLLINIII